MRIVALFQKENRAQTIIVLMLGMLLGFVLAQTQKTSVPLKNIREGSSEYTFINPLLFVKALDDQNFPEYMPLKKGIADFVDASAGQGNAFVTSVYFRDLAESKWISINPDNTFSPASMLKVITLITVLRAVESNPKLLQQKVVLEGDDSALTAAQVRYATQNPVRSGKSYTIEELLGHLITESDNVANVALIRFVGDERIKNTYEDLQVPYPDPMSESKYTTEEYSHIFRVLYNATYLSRTYSEMALDLLSDTTFTKGLVAGVPDGTLVAHKFGVRTVLSNQSTKDSHVLSYRELHDCGIVYYPGNPYFLCVMTKGDDFTHLESVIRDVSRLVWEYKDKMARK